MNIIETHIVPAIDKKVRLQEYAFTVFQTITTRSALKKAIKKKLLLLNGKPANTSIWIETGQKLELLQDDGPPKKIFKYELPVLFEDNWIAVVHKPAGIPTSGNYFRTVENALPHNLKKSTEFDALRFPLPVHRLDSPTAGILLVAKTRSAQIRLNEDFSEKNIQKIYYALVHGLCQLETKIDTSLEDKSAQTLVRNLQHYQILEQNYSLVEAKPLTGRTHQIRIHLESVGHPIVGDELYGHIPETYFKNKNLFLFAGGIEFKHPVSQLNLSYKIDLPKRFQNLDRHKLC